MNRVHYQWITFVLFFTGLLVMFSLYSTITTGTFIAQDLSVPVFQAPYASMAFSFAFAFGCLVYGLLSDKLGRKRVMIYGLIAHTIFTVISVFRRRLPCLSCFVLAKAWRLQLMHPSLLRTFQTYSQLKNVSQQRALSQWAFYLREYLAK